MAFSVNTNLSAFTALQSLRQTNQDLTTTQSRINTGLKVASPKDNGAIFAIAQNLRADVSGLNAVKTSLDRAASTVDVAVAAGEAISDLLTELKEKAVAAKDTGLDTSSRVALNDDFKGLRDQISSIVQNAEFNGKNLISATSTALTAITNPNGSNTITVGAQDLSLSGSLITLSSNQTIGTATLASAAVTTISASASAVGSALSSLGSGSKRIEILKDFVSTLSDTIEVGIGNLVDADLAKESVNLQAQQVKQQLGLQALSIANSTPSAVLSLFN